MIRHIELRNFQKWKSLVLDLDPQITVLVGPTDVGKSAVIRALRWLCLNRPGGEEFRRFGSKLTKVRVTLLDGTTVQRIRSNTRNEYWVDDKVFRAFGTSVPVPVQEALGLTDSNFQSQMDSVFWFSLGPGQLSREINDVVDLSAMDTALATAAANHRFVKTGAAYIESRLPRLQAQVAGLSWEPNVATHFAKCEATYAVLQTVVNRRKMVARCVEEIEVVATALGKRNDPDTSMLQPAIKLVNQRDTTRNKLAQVISILENLKSVETSLCQVRVGLKRTQTEISKIDRCPLCSTPTPFKPS